MSQGRSGSSFLFSWLEPQTLAFMEPCSTAFHQLGSRDLLGSDCLALIDSLRRCDFSHVDLATERQVISPEDGFKGWGNRSHVGQDCPRQVKTVKEIRISAKVLNASLPLLLPGTKVVVLTRDPWKVRASRKKHWPAALPLKDAEQPGYHVEERWGLPHTQATSEMFRENAELRAIPESDGLLQIAMRDIEADWKRVVKRLFGFLGLRLERRTVRYVEDHMEGRCEALGRPFSVCRRG